MGPEFGGHVLNFPGKMLLFNQEASDLIGGPRPTDENPPRLCPYEPPGPSRGRWTSSCWAMQGSTESITVEMESAPAGPFNFFNYLPPSDRAFLVGAHPDSERSVRSPLAARYYLDHERLEWLFDPLKKAKNTGAHFAIFVATNCVGFRDAAVKRIAQLGEVHVGPNYLRRCKRYDNIPSDDLAPKLVSLPNLPPRSAMWSNWELYRDYKFALVMENTYRDGYVTEKILMAFQSGAVPIWYGGKYALDIFNSEAMVFYDVENPESALNRIRELRDDPKKYENMTKEPILKDGNQTISEYFSIRDEVGGGRVKRKIRKMLGIDDKEFLPQAEPS